MLVETATDIHPSPMSFMREGLSLRLSGFPQANSEASISGSVPPVCAGTLWTGNGGFR